MADSNSDKSREIAKKPKRAERLPIKKELGPVRQFITDVFLPDEEEDLTEYMGKMFSRYIRMFVDNTVHYICSGELDRDDYKPQKKSSSSFSSYGGSRNSYDAYYDKADRTRQASNRVKEFSFTSEEANDVMDDLYDTFGSYGQLSVAQYYESCGYKSYDYTANDFGWLKLDTFRVIPLHTEDPLGNKLFSIVVPKPVALPRRN